MKNDVLEALSEIDTTVMQSDTCVMESLISLYDKTSQLIDCWANSDNDGIDSVYLESMMSPFVMESKTSNKKEDEKDKPSMIKKIVDSIVNFVKSFFAMIQKAWANIMAKLGILIKKSHEPVNSIMLKSLMKSKYNQPDDIASWKVPTINPKYIKNKGKSNKKADIKQEAALIYEEGFKETPITSDKDGPVRVTIPAGPGSIYASTIINIPKHDVVVGFDDSKKKVKFHIFGSGKFHKTTAVTTSVKGDNETIDIGKTENPWSGNPRVALYLITKPEEFDKITDLVTLMHKVLKNMNESDIKKFNDTCQSTINSIYKNADKIKPCDIEVPLSMLTEFQRKLSKQTIRSDEFADTGTDVSKLDKKTVQLMNYLTKKLLRIQISMNMLSSSIDDKDIIDANFIGCIKNVALLDIFVNSCIKAGLPPKYVAYNTWLVADKCIRGEGDQYKPVWGQTRSILFPPAGKVVYKIAMSGAGITSNEAEVRTSKLFVDADRVDLIAPIVRTWENGAIVAMERIAYDGNMSYLDIAAYKKEADNVLKQIEKKTGTKLNIKLADTHKGNVKFDKKYGIPRSIDYGIGKRSYK